MKCEGETGTEAGLGRGEGVAWLWAGRFSFHIGFVSLLFRAEQGEYGGGGGASGVLINLRAQKESFLKF